MMEKEEHYEVTFIDNDGDVTKRSSLFPCLAFANTITAIKGCTLDGWKMLADIVHHCIEDIRFLHHELDDYPDATVFVNAAIEYLNAVNAANLRRRQEQGRDEN